MRFRSRLPLLALVVALAIAALVALVLAIGGDERSSRRAAGGDRSAETRLSVTLLRPKSAALRGTLACAPGRPRADGDLYGSLDASQIASLCDTAASVERVRCARAASDAPRAKVRGVVRGRPIDETISLTGCPVEFQRLGALWDATTEVTGAQLILKVPSGKAERTPSSDAKLPDGEPPLPPAQKPGERKAPAYERDTHADSAPAPYGGPDASRFLPCDELRKRHPEDVSSPCYGPVTPGTAPKAPKVIEVEPGPGAPR